MPHLVLRGVQCWNPLRAAAMYRTSVSDWHLGQRGRAAAQGDRVCADESGNHPSYGIRRTPTELLSPMGADGRAVITRPCRLGSAARWSILLTFEKFDGMTAGQTIDG